MHRGQFPGNKYDKIPYVDPFDPNRTAGKTCSFNVECGPGELFQMGAGTYGVVGSGLTRVLARFYLNNILLRAFFHFLWQIQQDSGELWMYTGCRKRWPHSEIDRNALAVGVCRAGTPQGRLF